MSIGPCGLVGDLQDSIRVRKILFVLYIFSGGARAAEMVIDGRARVPTESVSIAR